MKRNIKIAAGGVYIEGILAVPEKASGMVVFAHGMMVPGVGDFGDRYFGYSGRAVL